jgi:hypothetical protein
MKRFQQIRDWTPGYINVCPHHVDILVRCESCGREAEFDRRSLPPLLRHSLVEEIAPRLRCSCGAKQAKLLFGNWVE